MALTDKVTPPLGDTILFVGWTVMMGADSTVNNVLLLTLPVPIPKVPLAVLAAEVVAVAVAEVAQP